MYSWVWSSQTSLLTVLVPVRLFGVGHRNGVRLRLIFPDRLLHGPRGRALLRVGNLHGVLFGLVFVDRLADRVVLFTRPLFGRGEVNRAGPLLRARDLPVDRELPLTLFHAVLGRRDCAGFRGHLRNHHGPLDRLIRRAARPRIANHHASAAAIIRCRRAARRSTRRRPTAAVATATVGGERCCRHAQHNRQR